MKVLKVALLSLALLTGASVAHASPIVIAFSGSGSTGAIAPGESWAVNATATTSWGAPGIGLGILPWNGAQNDIDGFTITFSGLPGGVVLSNTFGVGCGGGATGGTVFCSGVATFALWTPVISDGGTTITFTAPGGTTLGPGKNFFVNLFFTGNEGSTVNFTGGWTAPSGTAAVPEPATMVLLGTGLVGLALRARRRLQK